MERVLSGVICLCGNDGTGKSTLLHVISQRFPEYTVIERSSQQTHPSLESLRQQIKHLDLLTYRYAFEQQRYDFEPSKTVEYGGTQKLPVYWIMLDLPPLVITKRISQRELMGKYESKKCVQYFSYVYLELAAFYGMTIVDVSHSPEEIVSTIVELITTGATKQIRQLNLKQLSLTKITDFNVANQVTKSLSKETIEDIISLHFKVQTNNDAPSKQFYYPQLQHLLYQQGKLNMDLGRNIAERWIINNFKSEVEDGQLTLNYKTENGQYKVGLQSPSFIHCTEGESKQIYQVVSKIKQVSKYFQDKVWIILKSTIYSHTNQNTGEIENLGQIRAVGSNLFLQMLRRNHLCHAYIAINAQGIIFSRKIITNGIEIIFKKEFVGTDRHSYYGLQNQKEMVSKDNHLTCGIYVRFDWRNPNHILLKHPSYVINQNPYYYIIEKTVGKEVFFNIFLQRSKVKPVGDKCISEDLVKSYADIKVIKKAVLSLYCSFAYYCRRVNLEIVDGCFMFNKDGSIVWSEINPDCMRVKKIETGQEREDYDKDIWRAGGSSSKELIKEKWRLFNKLLINYFLQNRFHETELLQTTPLSYPMNEEAIRLLENSALILSPEYKGYFMQIASNTQKRKEVIATIDISEGKPTLVKSSLLSEHHSDNILEVAYNYINILPKIVLVDLDAAMDKPNNNRQPIKQLKRNASNNIYGIGGGIRTLETLNYYLNNLSVPRAILSSSLELLDHLPRHIIENRIIVELSINEKNEVLTHGRTVNTGQNIIGKMMDLCKKGVKVVSLTFNQKEGHLQGIPRDQFRDIMFQVPGPIQKVIIAGGISSFKDLQYIWGFSKAIPQLGSALWKSKISVSGLLCNIVNFDNEGLCSTVVTTQSGKLLGQIFLDQQALKQTAQTRQVYHYSRKLRRIIKMGEQSGNNQKVVGIRLDCDNDCLNVIVEESPNPFCHFLSKSCFELPSQNQIESIEALQSHILWRKESGSGYSKKMQENQNLATLKFIEECNQLALTKNRHIEQGADTLAHLLMFLNAKHISIKPIIAQLNARAHKVKWLEDEILSNQKQKQNKEYMGEELCQKEYIGLMGSKFHERLDKAILQLLGVQIHRATNRSLEVTLTIQNRQKYDLYFKDVSLRPLVLKSKDMCELLFKNEIKWCYNYSIMMQNSPKIWKELARHPIPTIKLVVLKKTGKTIDPFAWTRNSKGKVVSEYPMSMINYLNSIGVDESHYSIVRVSGGTEGFLQCDSFDYCDAIVETGRTVSDNNLEIVKVLCEQIYGSLYTLL